MSDTPDKRVDCRFRWAGWCTAIQPWHYAGALCAFVLLSGLSGYPLLDPDEGRYAEVSREMLERGDLLSPTLNYVPYWEKPPLFYWLNAAALHVLGETPFAVRIGTAVVAVLGLLVAWWLARVTFGSRAARWAPSVLGASWMYFALARVPIIDMLVSALMAASLTAWYSAENSAGGGRVTRWVISGVFLGLATLAKGPVALLLAAGIIGVYLLLQHRWRDLLPATLAPLLVGAAVAAPWFVAMAREHPDFLHYFFWVQHVERFLGSGPKQEHVKPFYYFWVLAWPGFLPWSALWPGMLVWLGTRWRGLSPEFRRVAHYLLAWALVTMLFFSASSCKLVQYILPIWWVLAVTAAAWLVSRVDAGQMRPGPRRGFIAVGCLLLLGVVGAIVAAGRQHEVPLEVIRHPLAIFSLATAIAASIFMLVGLPGQPDRRLGLLVVAGLLPLASLVPAYRVLALRRDVATLVPPALMHLPPDTPWTIAQYRCYNQNLNFQTHRRVVLVDNVNELSLGLRQPDAAEWFMTGEASIARLSARGPLALVTHTEFAEELVAHHKLEIVAGSTDRALLTNAAGARLLDRGEVTTPSARPSGGAAPRNVSPSD